LDDLESFGIKRLEDFTWKHMLDFYSCADCGRCSDNCPANAVGRPLSPRFITIKGRDLIFKNYPIYPYGSPFCLVNMEDAIKVAGMEGKMEAIDLSELIVQHMQ
jgi:Fe-S oxidoreductase